MEDIFWSLRALPPVWRCETKRMKSILTLDDLFDAVEILPTLILNLKKGSDT